MPEKLVSGASLNTSSAGTARSPEKLKYLAESESAINVFINDVRPEEAAQMLRDAVECGRRQ